MPFSPLIFSRWAVLLLALVALRGFSAPPPSLVPYGSQIEQAYNDRDTKAIETAILALHKAGAATGQEDLAAYYGAFGRLRQSAVPGISKSQAKDYLNQCIDELAVLLKRNPNYAEAQALSGSCLGASANYSLLRAASRGIAAGQAMTKAVKLAPNNAWVVFQDAVADYLTPSMFGGNKERAVGKLKRAEQLFKESRPPGSTTPVFGEAETWLYLGRVYLATGHKTEARAAWETALTLSPVSQDVKDELGRL